MCDQEISGLEENNADSELTRENKNLSEGCYFFRKSHLLNL